MPGESHMSTSFGKRGLGSPRPSPASGPATRRPGATSAHSAVPVSLRAIIVASAGLLPLQLAFLIWDGTLLVENLWRPIEEHGADAVLSMVPILCLLLFSLLFNAAHFAALYLLPAHATLRALGVASYLGYMTATAISGVAMEAVCRLTNLFPVGHTWMLPALMGALAGLAYRWAAGVHSGILPAESVELQADMQ
jgi:hypothetical protein